MSANRKYSQEHMFHIQYPHRKDFLSWIELGCLARALGFPTNLVRDHLNHEVDTEKDGMTLQQFQKMIDLKLLHPAVHRSCNHHTADWNLCVIQRAIKFLHLNILSFEELHKIRVAYATYEASDMKGLYLDQRTLLRTLKMCHRVISPKKLMHRVKHMTSKLDEQDRIQLYEFFDLILWCDYMDSLTHVEHVDHAEGKENELYNMVDFERLLSHQDERQSRALDERYLAEEWDFGREQLGCKQLFKDEVVYTHQRIKQTHVQKQKYRGLKRAVNQSQRQVYRAHAGSIRARPLSAPDLAMYATPRSAPQARCTSAAAVYESVQRRLHSAPSRASRVDVSDKPTVHEYVRVHTPSVITADDLDDVTLKMARLEFDITTLESRCQVKMEDEVNFYIPGFVPRPREPTPEPEPQPDPKPKHWTPEIIEKLVNPHHPIPPSHAYACDARFRGWKMTEGAGRHRVLTFTSFDNSPHGRMLAKQRALMLAPVGHVHKNYVVRYTSKDSVQQQPERQQTPKPNLTPRKSSVKRLGGKTTPRRGKTGSHSGPMIDITVEDTDEEDDDEYSDLDSKTFPDPYGRHTDRQGNEANSQRVEDLEAPAARQSIQENFAPTSSTTVPHMRNTRSKKVEVGLMGTIKLLESIQEQEMEERLSEASTASSPKESNTASAKLPTSLGVGETKHSLAQSENSVNTNQSARDRFEERKQHLLNGGIGSSGQSNYLDKNKKVDSSGLVNKAGQHSTVDSSQGWTGVQKQNKEDTKLDLKTKDYSQQQQRKDSTHSTISSDSGEEPNTPLTSVSVTVKERMNSNVLVNDDLTRNTFTAKSDITRNEFVSNNKGDRKGSRSSSGTFRSKSSPRSPLKTDQSGRSFDYPRPGSANARRLGSGKRDKPKSADSVVGSASLPVSPNKQETFEWIQDQVLAMNGAGAHRHNSTDSGFMDLDANRPQNSNTDYTNRPQNSNTAYTINSSNINRQAQEADKLKTTGYVKDSDLQRILNLPDDPDVIARLKSKENSRKLLQLPERDYSKVDKPHHFTFNKVTTRRLIQRVAGGISPELRSRLKSGNTGVRVQTV